MKLIDLVKEYSKDILSYKNVEIVGLCHDSRKVKNGDMFFCIDGEHANGSDYAREAVKNGAVCIVTQSRINNISVPQVIVDDVRSAMALFASKFFCVPSSKMKVVMVTGTNGKTTTTFMIKNILDKAGIKCGVVGTNGIYFDGKKIVSNMTTPDPIFLEECLAKMVKCGVKVVIMEMSAHALYYRKNLGIMSDISVFTNISQDHLDFFFNMENYAKSKELLFQKNASRFAVINIDDEEGLRIKNSITIPCKTISLSHDADYVACNISRHGGKQYFILQAKGIEKEMVLAMDGKFNVSNALGAIAATLALGVNLQNVYDGLASFVGVDGRFNSFMVHERQFVVDFAHTPDGITKILEALLDGKVKNQKLITVFGCGGNRDKQKRPIMGEIASRLSDFVFVSSDNPRYEKLQDIIADITKGITNHNFETEVDRTKALWKAYKMSKPGDIIAILGKGAEDYFDINGTKLHYSDKEVIEEIERNE